MRHFSFSPRSVTAITATLLLAIQPTATAAGRFSGQTDEMRVGRYTVVGLGPTSQQQHPLQSLTTGTPFTSGSTVGQAMRVVLAPTGYALVDPVAGGAVTVQLLQQPLPAVQQKLPRMPARVALQTLAGEGFLLVIDPINRLVGFEPAPRYRALAGS